MAHCVYSGEQGDPEDEGKRRLYRALSGIQYECLFRDRAGAPRILERGLHVGLGSDVAGGSTENLFRAMAHAVQASKLRWRIADDSHGGADRGGGVLYG